MTEGSMKPFLSIFFIATLIFTLGGCSKGSTEDAAASSVQPDQPLHDNATSSVKTAAPATPAKPKAPKAGNRDAERPSVKAIFQIPEGTPLNVTLIDALSSKTNKSGDVFLATLAEPMIVHGDTVLARGVKLQGRVLEAEGSGRVKGRAKMSLALTNVLDGQKEYPISTSAYSVEAESTKKRDAGIIGGAAGIGAAIGAIAGGGKGAAEGALIGGAAGTGGVLVTKGKEVEFEPETKLKFTLDKSAALPKIASKSF